MNKIGFLIIVPILSFGALAEDVECMKNQETINDCAEKELKKLDEQLNVLYQKKLASQQSQEEKIALQQAELSWIKFKEKDCAFQLLKLDPSGSAVPMMRFNCMAGHTKRRIEDLKSY